jgi:ABC-2 type transport system ATP-binding protein
MEHGAVILAEGLTRRFGDVVAVDHLDLEVQAGEVLGFLGHNGAGKTTTVRLLNGVLTADGGRARVLGFDPASQGPALRAHTGVLTETPSLDERLTGRDNLALYAEMYGVAPGEVARRVQALLENFQLAERAEEKVAAYSRGMKQRLALARALVHRPQVLFLDEPTSGLDPVAARHVHEMVADLSGQEGRTVFLCTHNLAEAQKLCDRVAVLAQGRVLALGTPSELAARLGRTQRLEVEAEPAAAALEVAAAAGVGTSTQENGRLALLGLSRDEIPGLVAALVAAGVRIYRVTPEEPSLEDVYFALQGEEVAA